MADLVVSGAAKLGLDDLLKQLAERINGNPNFARFINARLAWTLFGRVFVAFNEKGRGQRGSDGIQWAPLSKKYLAYRRGVTGPHPPRAGRRAPGNKDGYMTVAQLRRWQQVFARNFAWLAQRHDEDEAKATAAAIAWNDYKAAGGKTKLGTFGERVAGQDYQILVDRGILRNSLSPGTLSDDAYAKPQTEQIYEERPGEVVIGSAAPYAGANHARRPFWPADLPQGWLEELANQAALGVRAAIIDAASGGFAA